MDQKPILSIVGLGYVGLPLAYAFAKKGYVVHGFDINVKRVEELNAGHDRTNEIEGSDLQAVGIDFTTDPETIRVCDVIIMAIPTPVDDNKKPDLTPVIKASQTVGKHLKKGAIVVYESTVYPGVTEEICGPILERESGMRCGTDFFLGYSPERINPGDRQHTIDKIVKIVAGQDEHTTDVLCDLYGSIVTAGIHRAPNIKTAEMSKAIENAQRDLNIAYMNEIALLCHKIGIETTEVIKAASTKWNFLPFQPGLVGGHCIGVDPYYLVEKAQQLGMTTHVITAGRAVNDGMAIFIGNEAIEAIGGLVTDKRILIMGLTFKENIPDIRNSQSFHVMSWLKTVKGADVFYCDPFVAKGDHEWIDVNYKSGTLNDGPYDAILLLVKHKEYIDFGTQAYIDATKKGGVIYDVKNVLDKEKITAAGRTYLAL